MKGKGLLFLLVALLTMAGVGAWLLFKQKAVALEPPPARFVATVKPLEFILRELCGQRAEVELLLKPGANAHTYDPTPQDARAVQTATALVWVGENYDGWARELNCRVRIECLPLLPPGQRLQLATPCTHDHGHGAHPHTHEVDDPHLFTDPLAVQALLPGLSAQLIKLDPAGKADYERNMAAFSKQLSALDRELRETLAPIKGRAVLQFHPSFNYFIARYGLVNAGVIEEIPGKEPSPKYLQGVVRQVKAAGVRAIFSETLLPRAPAEVIAEAAAVPLYELDPSCGSSERVYSSYADWLRYNAQILLKALR